MPQSRLRRPIAAIVAILALAIIAWSVFPTSMRQEVAAASISPRAQSAYTFKLDGTSWFVHSEGDTSGAPSVSTLVLLENGRPLAPAHAPHHVVETAGRGAHSHWWNTVIFSASDDSDPRSNGRSYVATYRIRSAAWLVALAWLGLAALAAIAAWPWVRHHRPAVVAAASRAVALTPHALFAAALAASLTHAIPLHGERAIKPTGQVPFPGASQRPALLVPFERFVGAFRIVPSGDAAAPGPFRVARATTALREVFDVDGWVAANEPIFFDFDRFGGDGLAVWWPGLSTDDRAPVSVSYRVVVTPGGVALLWAAFALALGVAWRDRRLAAHTRPVRALAAGATAFAGAGAILLALNLAGLAIPPRDDVPQIRSMPPNTSMGGETWIPLDSLRREIEPRPGEARDAYAARMNMLVASNVLHLWNYANAGSLRLHVPPWSNYVLWGLGEVDAQLYRYHYAAWRPALERGVGMCSQSTLIVVGLLRDAGYDARIVQLDGHTVVTAEVAPDKWHIFDPDIGLSMPYDLAEIERDPELVRAHYARAYRWLEHWDPAYATDRMVEFYDRRGNSTERKGGNEMLGELWVLRERLAGIAKWALPAALIAFAALLAFFARRARAATGARGPGPAP